MPKPRSQADLDLSCDDDAMSQRASYGTGGRSMMDVMSMPAVAIHRSAVAVCDKNAATSRYSSPRSACAPVRSMRKSPSLVIRRDKATKHHRRAVMPWRRFRLTDPARLLMKPPVHGAGRSRRAMIHRRASSTHALPPGIIAQLSSIRLSVIGAAAMNRLDLRIGWDRHLSCHRRGRCSGPAMSRARQVRFARPWL